MFLTYKTVSFSLLPAIFLILLRFVLLFASIEFVIDHVSVDNLAAHAAGVFCVL